MSSQELMIEIAAHLYEKRLLTIGQARRLASLPLIPFQQQLAKRKIAMNYNLEDLEKDLHNLGLSL